MGSVFKLKSGKWAIRYDSPTSTGERKQKQKGGFATQKDAKKALSVIEAQIVKGTYCGDDVTTCEKVIKKILDYDKNNLAGGSYVLYERTFNQTIIPQIGKLPPRKVSVIQLEEMLQSTTNIHAVVVCLNKLFTACVRYGLIITSPMPRVQIPKQKKKVHEYWDKEEISIALNNLDKCNSELVRTYIVIALLTGLRKGEITALTEDCIDFEHMTIRVEKNYHQNADKTFSVGDLKTESSMDTIPMLPIVAEQIKRQIQHNKKVALATGINYNRELFDKGFFMLSDKGKFVKNINRPFTEFCWKVGLPIIRFHDMRHSFASFCVANNIDMKVIQKLMRHSSFNTTANTYAHVADGLKSKAMEKIGETLFNSTGLGDSKNAQTE